MSRPIAMGVKAIRHYDLGDGVPGTMNPKTMPNPSENAVSFNFADPEEVRIPLEGTDEPLLSHFKKGSTDYVEVSYPSPGNEVIADVMGGTYDEEDDEWQEPVNIPSINKTVEIETMPINGKKVIYTIVNAKIVAKLSQAPTKDNVEMLMVRYYKQAAISAAGVQGYAFSRKVVAE
ncbi:hypothetical protein SAMN05216357_11068 [Porphyromonadaceae bacterium KH3CP3RA]|nr:hypothetical protein SAMN05216357_11068 [Porphyromonadaceae bacterium KH3CP3RA]